MSYNSLSCFSNRLYWLLEVMESLIVMISSYRALSCTHHQATAGQLDRTFHGREAIISKNKNDQWSLTTPSPFYEVIIHLPIWAILQAQSRDILSFENGFLKSGRAQVSLDRVEISQDSDWP